MISFRNPSYKKSLITNSIVLLILGYLALFSSCRSLITVSFYSLFNYISIEASIGVAGVLYISYPLTSLSRDTFYNLS